MRVVAKDLLALEELTWGQAAGQSGLMGLALKNKKSAAAEAKQRDLEQFYMMNSKADAEGEKGFSTRESNVGKDRLQRIEQVRLGHHVGELRQKRQRLAGCCHVDAQEISAQVRVERGHELLQTLAQDGTLLPVGLTNAVAHAADALAQVDDAGAFLTANLRTDLAGQARG